MDWFRSWHGAPTDSKWLAVAKRSGVEPGMVSAVFWALLDYASQHNKRGSIANFDTEVYALWSGWNEDIIISIMDAMRAKDIITKDDRLAMMHNRSRCSMAKPR